MNFWVKLALREISNNAKFSVFFVTNLVLGLVGFIALDSFKVSLDRHLRHNSRQILTADLGLFAYRPFQEKELERLTSLFDTPYQAAERVGFYSMIAGVQNSRLVEVVAIGQGFPLYGKIQLKEKGRVTADLARKELQETNAIWVYPELLTMLELKEGEVVQIGQQGFQIADVVLEDPSNALAGVGLAPRIYMSLLSAEKTGLLVQGSRIHYQKLYQFLEDTDVPALAEKLRDHLEGMPDSNQEIRIQTHQEASENLGRTLNYLNDYLGLVALIGLFLANIGAAYLFRDFLRSR